MKEEKTESNALVSDLVEKQGNGRQGEQSKGEITAEASEAYKVRDILPSLEWCGGTLSVRIAYEVADASKVFREFVDTRTVVSKHQGEVSLWPRDLCDFLEKGRNFSKFIKKKQE